MKTWILSIAISILAVLFMAACGDSHSEDTRDAEAVTIMLSDDVQISITIATDEILAQYEEYELFAEVDDIDHQRIIFTTNALIDNFWFVEIGPNQDGLLSISGWLHGMGGGDGAIGNALSPQRPLVVTWACTGEPRRGIVFTEEVNQVNHWPEWRWRHFYLIADQDNKGGDMFLAVEFEPAVYIPGPVFHMTDAISITAGYLPWQTTAEEFFSNYGYDSFEEFVEYGYEQKRASIYFKSNIPIRDFAYVEVEVYFDGHTHHHLIQRELFRLDYLLPQVPLAVSWSQRYDLYPHRGITFVDENGNTHFATIHAHGYDGSLVISTR